MKEELEDRTKEDEDKRSSRSANDKRKRQITVVLSDESEDEGNEKRKSKPVEKEVPIKRRNVQGKNKTIKLQDEGLDVGYAKNKASVTAAKRMT